MAALQTLGSANGDTLALRSAAMRQYVQPLSAAPGSAGPGLLAGALPVTLPSGAVLPVASLWGQGALASNHSTSSSGDHHDGMRAAAAAPGPRIAECREGSAGDEEQCSVRLAASRAALQPAGPAAAARRAQSGSDGDDSSTPLGSEVAEPVAAAVSTFSGAPPAAPINGVALLAHGILPQQLQLLQLQHFLQQSQFKLHALPLLAMAQHKARGTSSIGCDGTSSASQYTTGPLLQPTQECTVVDSGALPASAVASAGRRRGRPPRAPGMRSPGVGRGSSQQAEKATGGGGGGRGRGRGRKAAAHRYHYELSDDYEEPDEDSDDSEEPEHDSSEEEEDDDEQPEDHMLGCNRCRFAPTGCNSCRARPFVSRPYARWKPEDARFQGVPSAPVFYPTPEEFADPLSYIAKIRPEAEKFGICRIVPPSSCWDPPFALGPGCKDGTGRDWFRFHTRKQFTSHLVMRPCSSDPQAPDTGKQQQEGAALQDQAMSGGRMGRMCMSNMEGLAGGKAGSKAQQGLLQQQQQQVAAAAAAAAARLTDCAAVGTSSTAGGRRGRCHPSGDVATSAGVRLVPPGNLTQPRPPGAAVEESLERYVTGLRAHPLLGVDEAATAAAAAAMSTAAGSSGRMQRTASGREQSGSGGGGRMESVGRRTQGASRMMRAAMANAAGSEDGEDDEESDSGSESDGGGEFGFTSSERMHTLRSFQAYCRWARSLHFGLPPFGDRHKQKTSLERAGSGPLRVAGGRVNKVVAGGALPSATAPLAPRLQAAVERAAAGCEPTVEEIEAEFWRIVERPTTDIVVETLYGSDLDSARHGSGFPLPPWRALPTDQRPENVGSMDDRSRYYACHPWNINNLPRAMGSVLRYIETDELITGVMVPWLYVGSCLSAFCWHVEDHALYSINYMHTGAQKVWYGVPAHASEQFEAAMRDAVPHLFSEDPLLLHRLVTHMSPTELRRRGVPVCRLVHEAGSFVITFPNAYHAGFNCGFNCAEAVNFAPVDWLPYGSGVVRKYRGQGKRNTISHDGLLIRLVSAAPAVRAAQLAATSLHLLRPSDQQQKPLQLQLQPQAFGAVKVESAGVQGTIGANGVVALKPEPCAIATGAAGYGEIASVAAGGDGHPPYSWQAGIRLSEVPPMAVYTAVGELTVRLDEEARRRAAARQFGVTEERSMSGLVCAKDKAGVHTCTSDVDCMVCKCDLYLSAIISHQLPGAATCPEHAADLGVPPEGCVMLVRHTLEELRALLDAALELFPEGHAAIAAAQQRLAAPPLKAIRRLGPIAKYGIPFSVPMNEQDTKNALQDAVCAVAGSAVKEPYGPYDPDNATITGVVAPVLDLMPPKVEVLVAPVLQSPTPLPPVKVEVLAPPGPCEPPTAAEAPPTTAAPAEPMSAEELAAAAERERLGPRQALLLGEQQAEVERREEQRRMQEGMKRARAQRAARRNASAGPRTSAEPATVTVQSVSAVSTMQAVSTVQPAMYVPAVAVIAPVPMVLPPPVLASTDAPLGMPAVVGSVPAVAVSVVPAVGVSMVPPAAVPPVVVQAAAAPVPSPSDLGAQGQTLKRSSRSLSGQMTAVAAAAAVEADRTVRPRRERRVPKHLLDAEMELAEEMQQVVAGAAAAAAPSPTAPSSPTAACAAAAARSGPPRTRGQAQPLSSSHQQQALVQQPSISTEHELADGGTSPASTGQAMATAPVLAAGSPAAQQAQGEASPPPQLPQLHEPHPGDVQDKEHVIMLQKEQLSQQQQDRQLQQYDQHQIALETEAQASAGAAATADDLGVSPRRSSRATRPSVRLMDVTTAGAAVGAAPAPGVLLLKRETTSGPSTSMRSGTVAARRLSLGLTAAPASLPPTAPPTGPGAPTAAVGMGEASQGQQSLVAAHDQLLAAADPSSDAEDAGADAPTALGPMGDHHDDDQHDGEMLPATDVASQAAGSISVSIVDADAPAPQLLQPPVRTFAVDPLAQAQAAHDALPQDLPSQPLPSQQHAQHCPEPTPVPLLMDQPGQEPVPHGVCMPLSAAVTPGRPVRKRKTALSNDMVIYGESATLFGVQAAAAGGSGKRKAGSDRRGAAGAPVGGTGGAGARQAQLPSDDDAVTELEDAHDSLASFEEDLRPMGAGMSPPHVLFGDLHRATTPSSPPMPLSLPGMGSRSHGPASEPAAEAAGSRDARHDMSGLGDVETDPVPSQAPHSPGLLGLHDHDHDHDHDVFMTDAGRPLALSASPSVSALEPLAALHPNCGGSPLVSGAASGVLHASSGAGMGMALGAGPAGASLQPHMLAALQIPALGGMGAPLGPGLHFTGMSLPASVGRADVRGGAFVLSVPTGGHPMGTMGYQAGVSVPLGMAAATTAMPSQGMFAAVPDSGFAAATSAASLFDGSRQGLSSLAASAAGEWADLDDLVAL